MKIMGVGIAEVVSAVGGLLFIWSALKQFLPNNLHLYFLKCFSYFLPRMHVTFDEYSGDGHSNEAYSCIKSYLGAKSMHKAEFLKADKSRNSKSLEISLDDGDEYVDVFNNVKIRWRAYLEKIKADNGTRPYEKKSYMLRVHSRHRDMVMGEYLEHVMKRGKEIQFQNRKRRLYTNNKQDDWFWKGGRWCYINFQHPASFDTLALDAEKKQEIMEDLDAFKNGKEYYAKIGKPWKRGYLLHGPPGTGKSTMIAAMANFLDYDIYDLELTSVMENAELKKLLIEIGNKSIIVIEDIDCSLDLAGTRKNLNDSKKEESKKQSEGDDKKGSKVTLSGLLNFIDGIWSACGEERIIIFTTNHIQKLDPALIRRGRMDMHIEMSHCKFDAFKVLAKNYLGIDSHPLFEQVRKLLENTDISPCDVAENLMPKRKSGDVAESCLQRLIEAIHLSQKEPEPAPEPEPEPEPEPAVETESSRKSRGKKKESTRQKTSRCAWSIRRI